MLGGDCYSRRWGVGIFCSTLFLGSPGTTIATHDDNYTDRARGEGRSRVADVAKGCDRGCFRSCGCILVRLRRCRGRQGRPSAKGHQGGSRVRNLPQRLHLLLHEGQGAVAVKARVHPRVPPNLRQDEGAGNDRGAPYVIGKHLKTIESTGIEVAEEKLTHNVFSFLYSAVLVSARRGVGRGVPKPNPQYKLLVWWRYQSR